MPKGGLRGVSAFLLKFDAKRGIVWDFRLLVVVRRQLLENRAESWVRVFLRRRAPSEPGGLRRVPGRALPERDEQYGLLRVPGRDRGAARGSVAERVRAVPAGQREHGGRAMRVRRRRHTRGAHALRAARRARPVDVLLSVIILHHFTDAGAPKSI